MTHDRPLPSDTFTRRLRAERERQRMSQATLARLVSDELNINIDASAITRMEQQTRTVRLDEAVAIAAALAVPLSTLLLTESGDENEALIEKSTQRLLEAHGQWDDLRREIAQLSRTIQVLSGGYDLYANVRDFDPDTIDPRLLEEIDNRVKLRDATDSTSDEAPEGN